MNRVILFFAGVGLVVLFSVCVGDGGGRLVTEVSPKDGGTVSRDIMQDRYPAGTNVVLTAEAAPGYAFVEWKGAISGVTRTINVATTGNMKVTAVFVKLSEPGPQLTDSRDGKTYRTVRIGTQTWMAENLNYQTGNSWCYDNDESNCNIYGRLYDWNTAMTACPAGWHLPTYDEWDVLNTVADYSKRKLRSTSGWSSSYFNGTDELGFSALPGGQWANDHFREVGHSGLWWSATSVPTNHVAPSARFYGMSCTYGYVESWYAIDKTSGLSVRCVRRN